jgi:putative acetyltransferase
MTNFIIRSEKVSDFENAARLIEAAFGQQDEAVLVNDLRDAGAAMFSLLAVCKKSGELLGHALFSPVVIESSIKSSQQSWQAIALAPISVLPKYQRQGIGKALIKFWLEEYADKIYNALVVLGDPAYYEQFGFEPAINYDIHYEHSGAEAAFQIVELKPGFLQKASGTVFYHSVFQKLL